MGKTKRAPRRNATRAAATGRPEYLRDPWVAAAVARGMGPEDAWAAYRQRNVDERLRLVALELGEVTARRHQLLAERSQLVDELRRQGWSWSRLSTAAGVSRPTLIQAVRR